MLTAVPSYITDAAVVAGAFVALVAAARTPIVSRPGKWMWSRLVADPLAGWLDRLLAAHTLPLHDRIDAIEYQLKPNSGHSMRDRVDATATAVGAEPAPPDDE